MTESQIKEQIILIIQQDSRKLYDIIHTIRVPSSIAIHYIQFIEHNNSVYQIQGYGGNFISTIYTVLNNMLRTGKISEQCHLDIHRLILEYT